MRMGTVRNNKLFVYTIRVAFISWIIIVTVLSLFYISRSDDNNILLIDSKVEVHAVAYFMGALMCFYSFKFEGIRFVILVGIGVFLLGVIFEVVQLWIPYRTFNPMDVVANGVGVVIFMILWSILFYYSKT